MERIRTAPARHPLDGILRTGSHVRLLRALVTHDGRDNLTARDVARRAGVSHTTAIRVLPELTASGIVVGRRSGQNGDHFLVPALAALFDDELHVDEGVVAFIRGRARERGAVVAVGLRRSAEGQLVVSLNGRRLEGWEAGMWLERLGEEIGGRFGEEVDLAIERREPSALRWLGD